MDKNCCFSCLDLGQNWANPGHGVFCYVQTMNTYHNYSFISISNCIYPSKLGTPLFIDYGLIYITSINLSNQNCIHCSAIISYYPSSFEMIYSNFYNNLASDSILIHCTHSINHIFKFSNIIKNNSPSRLGVLYLKQSFISNCIFFDNTNILFYSLNSISIFNCTISHDINKLKYGTIQTTSILLNTVTLPFFQSHLNTYLCEAKIPHYTILFPTILETLNETLIFTIHSTINPTLNPTIIPSIYPIPTIPQSIAPIPTIPQSIAPIPTIPQSIAPLPTIPQSIPPIPTIPQSIAPIPTQIQSFFFQNSCNFQNIFTLKETPERTFLENNSFISNVFIFTSRISLLITIIILSILYKTINFSDYSSSSS